jgi:hypothetical protein
MQVIQNAHEVLIKYVFKAYPLFYRDIGKHVPMGYSEGQELPKKYQHENFVFKTKSKKKRLFNILTNLFVVRKDFGAGKHIISGDMLLDGKLSSIGRKLIEEQLIEYFLTFMYKQGELQTYEKPITLRFTFKLSRKDIRSLHEYSILYVNAFIKAILPKLPFRGVRGKLDGVMYYGNSDNICMLIPSDSVGIINEIVVKYEVSNRPTIEVELLKEMKYVPTITSANINLIETATFLAKERIMEEFDIEENDYNSWNQEEVTERFKVVYDNYINNLIDKSNL